MPASCPNSLSAITGSHAVWSPVAGPAESRDLTILVKLNVQLQMPCAGGDRLVSISRIVGLIKASKLRYRSPDLIRRL